MWTILTVIPYRDGHGKRTKGNAVNIYAEIENLKGIVETLTDIQRGFDDREVDLTDAIASINAARDTLSDITADLEL